MKKNESDTFEVGALVALGLVASLHGEPSMAADVAREMNLFGVDISSAALSEYDKSNIEMMEIKIKL